MSATDAKNKSCSQCLRTGVKSVSSGVFECSGSAKISNCKVSSFTTEEECLVCEDGFQYGSGTEKKCIPMTTENQNCLAFSNKNSRCLNCKTGHSLDTTTFKCAQNPPNTTIKDCLHQEVNGGFYKCQICEKGFFVDSKGTCTFDLPQSSCFSGFKSVNGIPSCLACNYMMNFFAVDTFQDGAESRQLCRLIKSKDMVWWIFIIFLLMAMYGSYRVISKKKSEKIENHKELKN